VYETAKVLYERFLPLVQEHVATSPFAKVAFTGHSLGGSLGTLLMLMFLRRGVLPPAALSPAYTFGAPAIFCEGTEPGMCGLNGQVRPFGEAPPVCSFTAFILETLAYKKATQCSVQVSYNKRASGGARALTRRAPSQSGPTLLERLGLPSGAVRNVVMNRDIVPRAFACDYTLVADLLARVGEGFRGHACLQNPHGRKARPPRRGGCLPGVAEPARRVLTPSSGRA